MKKKLSYRDKLLELAHIYDVKEIQDYVKSKKNLTSGQLELILKKNNIVIPKDYKTSFVKENFIKPISKIKNNITEYRNNQIKLKNKFFRKAENFKYDTQRKFHNSIKNLWNYIGRVGLNFLNIIPTLGKVFYNFFSYILTELFNGIYNQKINPKSAKTVIIGFFTILGITTLVISGLDKFDNVNKIQKTEIKKIEIKENKEIKNPITKEKKIASKPKVKVKEKKMASKPKVKEKKTRA